MRNNLTHIGERAPREPRMFNQLDKFVPTEHVIAQTASMGAILSAFFHFLPEVAVVPPALYYTAMLYSTPAVQRWLHSRRVKHRHKRIKSRNG